MRTRDALTVLCIALTSLTAGSIFCFPLFGPSLTRDFNLTLTQTNTIWGGAVLGEYLTGGIWGVLADWYGSRALSIAAGTLFLVGYQLIANADVVAALDSVVDLDEGDGSVGDGSSVGDRIRPMAWGKFVLTVACFAGIGSAVAASYFAAVTASTRLFKSRPGLAIAGPLTLFSLSSLFLTSLGTSFFSDVETGDLRVPSFLSFLGLLLGATNFFSAAFMNVGPELEEKYDNDGLQDGRWEREDVEGGMVDERTSLLSADSGRSHRDSSTGGHPLLPWVPRSQTTLAFLASPPVWALGLLMLVGVGAGEMVLSSVGNMVVSLLGDRSLDESSRRLSPTAGVLLASAAPGIGPIALRIRANQVKLLAAANTVSRLLGGLLSDLIAPSVTIIAPPHSEDGTSDDQVDPSSQNRQRGLLSTLKRVQISRITMLLFAIVLSFLSYTWAAFGLSTVEGLPAFSIVVGISYGLIFTLVPSVVVAAYGTQHFGRNWGLLTYCCALGSLSYSLLYATVSDAVSSQEGEHPPPPRHHPHQDPGEGGIPTSGSGGGAICVSGPECFRASFVVSLLGVGIAFLAFLPVWRRWRCYL